MPTPNDTSTLWADWFFRIAPWVGSGLWYVFGLQKGKGQTIEQDKTKAKRAAEVDALLEAQGKMLTEMGAVVKEHTKNFEKLDKIAEDTKSSRECLIKMAATWNFEGPR